jgi:hypothetical protein
MYILKSLLRSLFTLITFGLFRKLSKTLSFARTEMLRHTEFHQFAPVDLVKPVNPHKVHNSLKELMEDTGANTNIDEGPVIDTYSLSLFDGKPTDLEESDYLVFSGCISGSVKKDKPIWLTIGFIVSALLIPVMGIGLGTGLLLGLYWGYLEKYGRGDLFVRYFGTYQRPENMDPGMKDWVIELDVMLSYNAAREVGGKLVKPSFDSMKEDTVKVLTKSEKSSRKLEPLYSEKPSDFTKRFPIQKG